MASGLIAGAGSGSGGASSASRAPVEQPDTLRSRQIARILDLVSEGPIEGLVADKQSVYLDGVPLQNSDGTFNFNKGVAVWTAEGTQDQSALPALNVIESEASVGLEVTAASSVTRTLSNPNVTAARVTLGFPQLTTQDPTTGDLSGASVDVEIDVQSSVGGEFVPATIGVGQAVAATSVGTHHYTTPAGATGVVLSVRLVATDYNFYPTTIEYRLVGTGTWWSVASKFLTRRVRPGDTAVLVGTKVQLPPGSYEFRLNTATPWVYTIDYAHAIVPSQTDTIRGKATTRYQRSYYLQLSGDGPWSIRVRRLTADSVSVNLRNNSWWDSVTEIVGRRLRYPNSALVMLRADASNFRSVPRRGYDMRGIKVQVPNNYDPVTRVYTGIWDGGFQTLWSDNPAWVFYDIVTNTRYGLGELIDPDLVDKWGLYTVAQYCDELVPDGFGGLEPRFSCNMYLQTQEEAHKVVTAIASIFRAMVYWSGGGISCAQDAPTQVSKIFSNANVIDGAFSYEGSGKSSRHTVALVSWNDPTDMYKSKIEYVEDHDGILRYGVNSTPVMAVGCTSRGQAHRMGRWLLYTERMETEVASFRAGMDTLNCQPGDVIQISDAPRAGARIGGRLAACTSTEATLDAAVTLDGAETYTLSVVTPEGTVVSRPVTSAAGTTATITWEVALDSVPEPNAMWALSASNLVPTTWRVVSVSEPSNGIVAVSALAYNESKFGAVESNLKLELPPTNNVTLKPPTPLPVTDLTLTESMIREIPVRIIVRVTAAWTPPSMWVSGYDVSVRQENGNWQPVRRTPDASMDLDGLAPGVWEVSVAAVSTDGKVAPAAYATINVIGEPAPPADVTGFTSVFTDAGTKLMWDDSPSIDIGDYDVRYGTTWETAVNLDFPKATTWIDQPRDPGTHKYWVAARDLSGHLSVNPVSTTVTISAAPAPDVSVSFSGSNCIIDWTSVAGSFATAEYEMRYGASWAAGVSLGSVKGTTHTLLVQWTGERNFWVAAHDVRGNIGAAGMATATVTPAPAPTLVTQGIDNNVLLYWDQVQGTLPTVTFEFRRGATWAGAELIGAKSGGFTTIFETVAGVYTYWAAAIDSAGNYGTPGSISATVNQPPDYVLKSDIDSILTGGVSNTVSPTDHHVDLVVVGNNVSGPQALIDSWRAARCTKAVTGKKFWEATINNGGIFPNTIMVGVGLIGQTLANYPGSPAGGWAYYGLNGTKYPGGTAFGATFTTGDVIGVALDTIANTLTFYKNGVSQGTMTDVTGTLYPMVGIHGTGESVTLNFGELPFVHKIPAGFNGYSNATQDEGGILVPVNATETFAEHFTSRGWSTPDNQIAAGFPLFTQPNLSPGYYEETLDFGTILASNKITLTPNVQEVTGTVTKTGKISVSADGSAWTDYDNVWEIYATNFRYVKVRVTFTAAGTTDLARLVGVNIRLDSKLKEMTRMLSCVSTDSGGTILYLTDDGTSTGNKLFIDVDAVQVTAGGTTQITAVYDLTDEPNPLSLKVLLFNAAGARASGPASVTVKGF